MPFHLQRHTHNPVLLPDLSSPWECCNVFNPSVIHHDGLFHMHYRAQGLDWVSRIGYAVSTDGLHWNRLREPVLAPLDGSDARGVEDPRVVRIEDTFYMTYTAFGREPQGAGTATYLGGAILPMLARSTNLITWERIGPLVVDEDNKDHVLFPRKIKGRYAALHRRRPHVWLAYSDDLKTWRSEDMAPIYGPRPENGWDATSVGSNGVPIPTEHGWLCLNHAYADTTAAQGSGLSLAPAVTRTYRLGVVLLDLDDPTKVIHRPQAPIFWPEEMWELRGDVPNVVFSNANPVVGATVYVYYGGADHVIGLATCPLADLIDYARFG